VRIGGHSKASEAHGTEQRMKACVEGSMALKGGLRRNCDHEGECGWEPATWEHAGTCSHFVDSQFLQFRKLGEWIRCFQVFVATITEFVSTNDSVVLPGAPVSSGFLCCEVQRNVHKAEARVLSKTQ
jgi:hypothetical protein